MARTAGQRAIQVGQGLARGEVLVQAASLGHALNLEAGKPSAHASAWQPAAVAASSTRRRRLPPAVEGLGWGPCCLPAGCHRCHLCIGHPTASESLHLGQLRALRAHHHAAAGGAAAGLRHAHRRAAEGGSNSLQGRESHRVEQWLHAIAQDPDPIATRYGWAPSLPASRLWLASDSGCRARGMAQRAQAPGWLLPARLRWQNDKRRFAPPLPPRPIQLAIALARGPILCWTAAPCSPAHPCAAAFFLAAAGAGFEPPGAICPVCCLKCLSADVDAACSCLVRSDEFVQQSLWNKLGAVSAPCRATLHEGCVEQRNFQPSLEDAMSHFKSYLLM